MRSWLALAALVASAVVASEVDPNKHFLSEAEWSEMQIDLSHAATVDAAAASRQRRHAGEDQPYAPVSRTRRQMMGDAQVVLKLTVPRLIREMLIFSTLQNYFNLLCYISYTKIFFLTVPV